MPAIQPYLTQLAGEGVTSDIISFVTHRSFIHVGGANDPLNNGIMVIGGGYDETDLFTGSFQAVKVLSDDWYSTNLKAIIVGNSDPIAARLQGQWACRRTRSSTAAPIARISARRRYRR
jgi:hypothetical protein